MRAEGLWFHVDGAYGAAAALTGRAARRWRDRPGRLAVIDPHKWLFQPYEAGAVLMREPGLLERTFALSGEYLRDTFGGEVNFRDRGIQLTRGTRALKLWLSVRCSGSTRSARRSRTGSRWPSTPRQCCETPGLGDRHAGPAGDRLLHPRGGPTIPRVRRDGRDGYAAPSTTVLRGQTVLRLCTINPRTTFDGDRGDDRADGAGRLIDDFRAGYGFSMPTEPAPLTLSQVVHRAVEVCDPAGTDADLADFFLRFEDADEPVSAIEDIEQRMAEAAGALDPEADIPSLQMAAAVATYLGFRRDEADEDREELLTPRGESRVQRPPARAGG